MRSGEPFSLPQPTSPYIFGMHDPGEWRGFFRQAGKTGWMMFNQVVGYEDNDVLPPEEIARWQADGFGVLARLVNAPFDVSGRGRGSIPAEQNYSEFAARCANFAMRSPAHIFFIGNEMNIAWHWPYGQRITPRQYAECFRQASQAIKEAQPEAWVIPSGLNPLQRRDVEMDDALKWFREMFDLLPELDGLDLHTYLPLENENAPGYSFEQFLELIPEDYPPLAVFISEATPYKAWPEPSDDWMQRAYARINRWNCNPRRHKILALLPYRWQGERPDGKPDEWNLAHKSSYLEDLSRALQYDYRWQVDPDERPGDPLSENQARERLHLSRGSWHEASADALVFFTDQNLDIGFWNNVRLTEGRLREMIEQSSLGDLFHLSEQGNDLAGSGRAFAPLPVGEAVALNAENFPYRHLILAPVEDHRMMSEAAAQEPDLQAGLRAALRLADRLGDVERLAILAGKASSQEAGAMVTEVSEYLQAGSRVESVSFLVEDDRLYQAFNERLSIQAETPLPSGQPNIEAIPGIHIQATRSREFVDSTRQELGAYQYTLGAEEKGSPDLRYTTAKVVLLGDGGVDKSALAARMVEKPSHSPATDREALSVLLSQTRHLTTNLQTDLIVWALEDTAQVHRILPMYLNDADAALLLFDASERYLPSSDLQYWSEMVKKYAPAHAVIFLVSTGDDGNQDISPELLESFVLSGSDQFFQTNIEIEDEEDIEPLMQLLEGSIAWDKLPQAPLQLYQLIDSYLAERKLAGDSLVSMGEIQEHIGRQTVEGKRPSQTQSEIDLALAVLQRRGNAYLLHPQTGPAQVLTRPELISHYAGAIVEAAHEDPQGALVESDILKGAIPASGFERLQRDQEGLVLTTVIDLLLQHEQCKREDGLLRMVTATTPSFSEGLTSEAIARYMAEASPGTPFTVTPESLTPREEAAPASEQAAETGPLSPREMEALALLASEMSLEAIARRLGIATSTLRGYMQRINRKLNTRSREQAVARGRQLGLIPQETPEPEEREAAAPDGGGRQQRARGRRAQPEAPTTPGEGAAGERTVFVRYAPQAPPPIENRVSIEVGEKNVILRFGRRRYISPHELGHKDFDERLNQARMQRPEAYGRMLFEAIIRDQRAANGGSGSTDDGYTIALERTGGKPRLELQLDAFNTYEWEYLWGQEGPLAVIEGAPFYRKADGRDPGPAPARPLKILAAICSPLNLRQPHHLIPELAELTELDIDQERDILEKGLERLRRAGLAEYRILEGKNGQPASWEALRQALQEGYQVLHILAHGLFAPDRSGQPVYNLVLEEGAERQRRLAPLSSFDRSFLGEALRLVVLAACRSAAPGAASGARSLAAHLVGQGVPAVIAMQGNLPIETAQLFTQRFYDDLARSGRIDMALAATRYDIYKPNTNSWDFGLPVLLTSASDGQLFEVDEARAAANLPALEPEIRSYEELAGRGDPRPRQIAQSLEARAQALGLDASTLATLRAVIAPDVAHPPLQTAPLAAPQDVRLLSQELDGEFEIKADELENHVSQQSKLKLPKTLFAQTAAALNAGKHVIFIGPPGTGKTSLAQSVCEFARLKKLSLQTVLATATADWTSFDTVGGLVPTLQNNLDFQPGIFLRAICEGQWLIIDEINRAEIDKAFGELFTLLSGQGVDLPYQVRGERVRVLPPNRPGLPWAGHTHSGYHYVMHPSWRILATMNVYDKHFLFQMSFAFMRRFAFVDADLPPEADFLALRQEWIEKTALGSVRAAAGEAASLFTRLHQRDTPLMSRRALGPAIAKDMIHYVGDRFKHTPAAQRTPQTVPEAVAEAVLLYAVPQLDGLDDPEITAIYAHLGGLFGEGIAGQGILPRICALYPHIKSWPQPPFD
ncbi:MAG: CHAT domain-containing protein [Chloroflexota bacterium]